MKLKSVILACGLALMGQSYAANVHTHQNLDTKSKKEAFRPGFCEIEIMNYSNSDVRVWGVFDDNTTIDFFIYRYEAPHYINLYYNGYCHHSMYITIQAPFSTIYSNYTSVYSTLMIYPALAGSQELSVQRKEK